VQAYRAVKRASELGTVAGAISVVWVLLALINPTQGLLMLAKLFVGLGLVTNLQGVVTLTAYRPNHRRRRQRELIAQTAIGVVFCAIAMSLLFTF
jgi:uncharacterized membrane protein HdeD (DUF308 family)